MPTPSPGPPTAPSPAAPPSPSTSAVGRTATGVPRPPPRRRPSAPSARCRGATARRERTLNRALGPRRADRPRRRSALRQPRRAELPPRRGDHGAAGVAGELWRNAARGQGQRVQPAPLLRPRLGLGQGVRHRRGRPALALGPVRRGHGSGRLPDRSPACVPPRRPRPGGADRRQPDADLVLAGGPLLRAAGLLRRARDLLLRAGARHGPGPRPRLLGAGFGAGALQPLLRRLRGRDRGGLADRGAALALARGAAGGRRGRRGGTWRCCRSPTRRPTRPTSTGSKTARWPNASGRPRSPSSSAKPAT